MMAVYYNTSFLVQPNFMKRAVDSSWTDPQFGTALQFNEGQSIPSSILSMTPQICLCILINKDQATRTPAQSRRLSEGGAAQ